MKTVHKIIDLCEELSDRRVNFNVDVDHFHDGGQSLQLYVQQWAVGQISITQSASLGDRDPEQMLALLLEVKLHGFRGES
jgi:hypothetical protein